MDLHSDKGRATIALTIIKIWKDEAFKQAFLADPKVTLENEGITLPDGVAVHVLENTNDVKYIPLSKDLDLKDNSPRLAALFTIITPIPEGKELRLVQNSDDIVYIVIPHAPPVGTALNMATMQLTYLGWDGVESVYVDTTEAVEVETTEVVDVETTEVAMVETTAEVVAEIALVLI